MNNCNSVLELRRGDSWIRRFVWEQGDVDMRLLISAAKFTIVDPVSKIAEITSTIDNGDIVVDSDLHYIDINIPPEKTILLAPRVYFCDLELTFIDNTVESGEIMQLYVKDDISPPSNAVTSFTPYRVFKKPKKA